MPAARRILMVNTEHGWRGGENQVWLLATGLDPLRWEVRTACQDGGDLDHRLSEAGAKTVPIRARGGFDLAAARALRRVALDYGVELVHAHASHAHSLALIATLGTGLPLVVSRRVDFPIGRSPISRWKYRRATRVVAVSEGVARAVTAGGVDPSRVDVVHDGVDPRRVAGARESRLRAELGIPAESVVFGITAFLTDHKDHRTLLRAFVQVEAMLPQAWLLIAGQGELEEELTALSRELKLSRCRFLGHRPDIAPVLGALDAFVISSHSEGLGSAVMDAMFAGLPVVSTRAGGLPELVDDGVDGVLVPIRDPEAMAAALVRLGRDGELRRRLGAQARAKSEDRFSAAHMVRGYEQVYERVLGPAT
jgi:glycosyltransferase involved in cell wall biosynthesis